MGGAEKCGKNHLAFTAPGPIYCQTSDSGTLDVVDKYDHAGCWSDQHGLGWRDIHVVQYSIDISNEDSFNAQKMADAANPVWERWVNDFSYACDNARTIVWDTESDSWELLRLARFGELAPKTGRDRGNVWGPVNAEYRRLLNMAAGRNVNLILIQRLKDEYANDKKTGRKERRGFADIGYFVQTIVWAQRVGMEFNLLVTDCRQNPSLNGMEIPSNHFDMLKSFVLEG